MNNRINLFKLMDEKLFILSSKLKEDPYFVKIQEKYSSLDDYYQNLIKMLMPLVSILIGGFIILSLLISNSSLREDLNLKEEIISLSENIITTTQSMNMSEGRILGSGAINDLSSFQQRIINTLSSTALDTSKIQLTNFESENLGGSITEAKVDLKFSDFSSQNFFNLIRALTQGRFKISNTQIRKSNETNFVEGLLSLSFFSKEEMEEE